MSPNLFRLLPVEGTLRTLTNAELEAELHESSSAAWGSGDWLAKGMLVWVRVPMAREAQLWPAVVNLVVSQAVAGKPAVAHVELFAVSDQSDEPVEAWPFRAAHDAVQSLNSALVIPAWHAAVVAATQKEDQLVEELYAVDKNLCRRFTEFLQARLSMLESALKEEVACDLSIEDEDDQLLDCLPEPESMLEEARTLHRILGNLVWIDLPDTCSVCKQSLRLEQFAPHEIVFKQHGSRCCKSCSQNSLLQDTNRGSNCVIQPTLVSPAAASAVQLLCRPMVRVTLRGLFQGHTVLLCNSPEVQRTQLWPIAAQQTVVNWSTMLKACGFSKDKELWDVLEHFDIEQKAGILNISKLGLAGGHPARRFLEKMNLRKRGLESEGNRTDMFFVLPDVLPIGGGTRGVLELSRQIKTIDVNPGDKELLHLCTVLEKTDVNGVVKAFLQLNAVQQRHLANRILQEVQQCDDDLLHCEEFTQVISALGFPAVFDQPGNPHPLKCHRMCRRQLCPVCLMCTGHQKAHCVGIKLNGNLCCEKAEMLTPMAELSWWIPGVDVDLVETAAADSAAADNRQVLLRVLRLRDRSAFCCCRYLIGHSSHLQEMLAG